MTKRQTSFSRPRRALAALAVIAMLFSGCGSQKSRCSRSFPELFDTVGTLTVYCGSQEEFDRLYSLALDELTRLDRLFDIYSEESGGLSQLNREKSLKEPHGDILKLLELGRTMHKSSGGKLNIAIGSVISCWREAREQGVLPEESRLISLSEHCGIDSIELSSDEIIITDPGVSLDVGAIAKGYACDKAAKLLILEGAASFALDLGGNVLTHGKKPEGDWQIGIKDPDGGVLMVLDMQDGSVVTSGDYERFYLVDGKRYSHIIDPETLYPPELYRSVTVICQSSAYADALSTALFCMELTSGLRLLEEYSARAVWVLADGSTVCSWE